LSNNGSSVESHESELVPRPAASAEFILEDIAQDKDEDKDEENGGRLWIFGAANPSLS